MKKKILFVGCGNMGKAILHGMIQNNRIKYDIYIVKKSKKDTEFFDKISKFADLKIVMRLEQISQDFVPNIVIFAVKPQQIDEIITHNLYSHWKKAIYISIIAGKTLDYFGQRLALEQKIVRVMPNLPIQVGEGVSVMKANKNMLKQDKDLVSQIFNKISTVIWVNDENEIDIYTALIGSGPAYFYSMIEHMVTIATKYGLSEKIAQKAIVQTAKGSLNLLYQLQESPTVLRQKITSKSGTTEYGLNSLNQDNKLFKLLEKTIKSAYDRSKELN